MNETDVTEQPSALPAVACSDWLAPFVAIARGIPDNWPGECVLRYDYDEHGLLNLSYHGINDVKEGVTINQWRALLGANDPSSGTPDVRREPR